MRFTFELFFLATGRRDLTRQWGLAAAAALPVFLSACGGGNDAFCVATGGDNCGTPPSTAIAEGLWGGATNTGQAFSLLVLENGQYFAAPTTTSGAGFVEGVMTASGGNFTDNAAVVYEPTGGVTAATMAGSFSAKQSISGTLSAFPAGTTAVSFSGDYNTLYDTPATVAEAAGTWTGPLTGGTASATVIVAADGSVAGVNASCTFTGSLKPRPTGKHVLDGTVTFGSACFLPAGSSMPFEAVVSGKQLVAVGVTGQRDHGFAFLGTQD